MKLAKIATAVLSLLAATGLQAQSVLRTVPTYDAPTNPNVVDLLNVAAPLTYPMFTAGITAGWGTNSAGVVDFDPASFVFPWVYPAFAQNNLQARYGAMGVNVMGMWFSRPADDAPPFGGAVPISGVGTLRVAPVAGAIVPFVIKLAPSNNLPIRRVGFTLLQQQTQQKVKVQWFQNGGPALVANMVVPLGPIPTKDICFARQTTVPGGIVGVEITVVNNITGVPIPFSIDDFGFSH